MLQIVLGVVIILIGGGTLVFIKYVDKHYVEPQYAQEGSSTVVSNEYIYDDPGFPIWPPFIPPCPMSQPQPNGVLVYYGVCDATGRLIPYTDPSPLPIVLINTSNEYAIKESFGGYTHVWDESWDTNGNITPVLETNWVSPTTTAVLLRSTDCQTWMPIFTNTACPLDEDCVYWDQSAPVNQAFYVSMIQQ